MRKFRIRFRLTRRKLSRTSIGRNWRNWTKTIVLLVSFIALAIWLERATDEAAKQLTSIPRHYWWWGLGIVSSITLIVGLFLKKKAIRRKARTTEVYSSSWFRRPAVVVILILVGIYAPITYFALRSNNEEWGRSPRRSSAPLSQLPADVALPIIAGCESGNGKPGSGRQFEADGKTPLRNREGSSAIGKYQIMASLHEKRARSLGYDIRTEEGNEGYARYLYAESDTLHWRADPRSRACWEPLLARARGDLPFTATSTPTTDTIFMVTVRPGQPAEVTISPGWQIVWWGDKSRFKSDDVVWRGEDKVRIFTARGSVPAEIKIHRYYDPDPDWWRRQ